MAGWRDLMSLKGERVLALVIDGGKAGKFRFVEHLRPRIFFNRLLRRILSVKSSKGAGAPRN